MAVTGYSVLTGNRTFLGDEGVGNSISGVGGGGGYTHTQLGRDTGWDDFTLDFDYYRTLDRGGQYGYVMFRRTGSAAFYALTWHYASGTDSIRVKSNNYDNSTSTGQIGVYSANIANPVTIKLTVVGSSIKVWVGGTLRIDITDTTHASGSIGFGYGTNSEWTDNWDNVVWTQEVSLSAGRRIMMVN